MLCETLLRPLHIRRSQFVRSRLSRPSLILKMALRTLSAKDAAALDEHLMNEGGFSIDQLMELAGLSVAEALHIIQPPTRGKNILLACGPGNNGGDGLVAARHLALFGYHPTVYYPKPSKSELFGRLTTQLKHLSIPFTDEFEPALEQADAVVDAVFGFSFKGEVREPFPRVIATLAATRKLVLAVDAPSSWNIEDGPPKDGPGKGYLPDALISLTAPKPLVKWFSTGRHFVGGRFLSPRVAGKFGLDIPDYKGVDQVVEVPNGEGKL